MNRSAYMIAAQRSAVAPENNAFANLELHDLCKPVILHCLSKAGISPHEVDELILANALYGGGNPARMAALAAGLPETVAGLSIDRQCVGGLDAIILAARLIESGAAKIVLAGGAESHSRRPHRLKTFADKSPAVAYDRPPFSPFEDADPDMHQAAEALAQEFDISRSDQDAFAINSHAKALGSIETLREEITPVLGYETDPYTRSLTQKTCDRSQPIIGSITPANTAIRADAAAFVVVVSEDIAKASQCDAVCIRQGATVGGPTQLPGLAPVAAIERVLQTECVTPNQVSVSEVMEAYAVQAIVCQRNSGLDANRMNAHGGALARGHPIGASGAILAANLYHQLCSSNGLGLAAIAAAGGLGTAALFES